MTTGHRLFRRKFLCLAGRHILSRTSPAPKRGAAKGERAKGYLSVTLKWRKGGLMVGSPFAVPLFSASEDDQIHVALASRQSWKVDTCSKSYICLNLCICWTRLQASLCWALMSHRLQPVRVACMRMNLRIPMNTEMCMRARVHRRAHTSACTYEYVHMYWHMDMDTDMDLDMGISMDVVRPISLLRLSLLRLLDSNFPVNSLMAWEFHPLNLRFCLSQTLWNPES